MRSRVGMRHGLGLLLCGLASLAPASSKTPAGPPEMSPYGWVGTWNWTLAAKGNSDGLAYQQSYQDNNSDYDYNYQLRDETYSSLAFRLTMEKVLSSSYATRMEFDYGTTGVNESFHSYTHYLNPPEAPYPYDQMSQLRNHVFGMSWGQRATSTSTWVPKEGWSWRWGPQGRAWHPSIDTKVSLLNDISAILGSTDNSYDNTAGSYSWTYGGRVSLATTLPLFNGCSLVGGYATPFRSGYTTDFANFNDIVRAQAAFDSDTFFESFYGGVELAWPQFGHPDPLLNANPDGRLFYPSLTLITRTFADNSYFSASSWEASFKLPLTPRSSVILSSEQFQAMQAEPVLQRYSIAWQIYASRPGPRALTVPAAVEADSTLALVGLPPVEPLVDADCIIPGSPTAMSAEATLTPLTPAPTPVVTPEMSAYGWVGTWNWTLADLGTSDGLALLQHSSSFNASGRVDQDLSAQNYASNAFRLSVEKVLSSSYASRLELDYGTSSVTQTARTTTTFNSPAHSTLNSAATQYRLQMIELSWGHRVNSSGAWVPADGWTMGWGPQGRAFRPALDAKLSVLMDQTNDSGGTYNPSSDLWAGAALNLSLPLFNGCSLLAGYSSPVSRSLPHGGIVTPGVLGSYAAFDSDSYFEALSGGFELAWPQFGHPDPLTNANPDGRLFRPKLSLLYRSIGSGPDADATSYQWALKLPLSPRWSLALATEQFQAADSEPVQQRYSVALQLYGQRPRPH